MMRSNWAPAPMATSLAAPLSNTSTLLRRLRSSTKPSQSEKPAESWPPARGQMGRRASAASRTAAATSASLAACTTSRGSLSLLNITLDVVVRLAALPNCGEAGECMRGEDGG